MTSENLQLEEFTRFTDFISWLYLGQLIEKNFI